MNEFCPKFGNLEGLRVVCVGSALAAPFAAIFWQIMEQRSFKLKALWFQITSRI